MYHPMLIFECHYGCLLAAPLRPRNASSHARNVPRLLRLLPRLQSAFPGVQIRLRGEAGFALPLLYKFCEFFNIQYAIGILADCVFQRRAEPQQKRLKCRYRRTHPRQGSFSSLRHHAHSWGSWPRQRRICYTLRSCGFVAALAMVIGRWSVGGTFFYVAELIWAGLRLYSAGGKRDPTDSATWADRPRLLRHPSTLST
jgi:hypothetical protein